MNNITDDTPIAMLTVGQLKEILSIDKIMGHLTPSRAPDKEVLTLPGLQGTVSLRSISSQVNERYRSTNRSIKAANFTLTVRRFSTGCRANHTRRSNRKTSGK